MTSSRNLPARLIVLSIWAALGWAVIALAWVSSYEPALGDADSENVTLVD